MKQLFERILKRGLYKLGYEARPITPLDLRDVTEDPVDAAYLAGRRYCVIEVPIATCRGALGFPYGRHSLQPYIRTARAYAESGSSSYEDSLLKEYHQHFQPKNVWEFLALPGIPHPTLLQHKPYAFVFPWEKTSLADKARASSIKKMRDNKQRGAEITAAHGGTMVGPVSNQKGELELEAIKRVTDSIRSRGYVRSDGPDGDILATPLIDARRGVRYLVWGGKHRIAALAALGFERVPLRINFIGAPRPEEVTHWPHVRDGLFTRDQALCWFNRIFEGRPPANAIPPGWSCGVWLESRVEQ
jgi:hypothetical protein